MTHADRSTSLVLPAILERVRPLLPADHRVFLVGGTVRDAILGRAAHDLDFVVLQGDALRLAKRVADRLQQSYYPLDVERCTGRVVVEEPSGPLMLDFALARGSDLTADLLARDFTVNALALPPEGRVIADVIDPTGGLQDLALKQIRAVGPGALLADPVRCLRAVRQAHELGFSLEMGTVTLVQQAVPRVGQVSAERLRDELVKILGLVAPVPAIHMLQALGLLAPMLPEVAALPAGAWEHTRRTIEGLFVLDDLEEVRPDLV